MSHNIELDKMLKEAIVTQVEICMYFLRGTEENYENPSC